MKEGVPSIFFLARLADLRKDLSREAGAGGVSLSIYPSPLSLTGTALCILRTFCKGRDCNHQHKQTERGDVTFISLAQFRAEYSTRRL